MDPLCLTNYPQMDSSMNEFFLPSQYIITWGDPNLFDMSWNIDEETHRLCMFYPKFTPNKLSVPHFAAQS